MGENVARFQHRQQLAYHGGVVTPLGVADVNHQLDPAFAGCTFGQPWHLHAENLECRRNHPRLNAANQPLVPVGNAQGRVEVDAGFGDYVREHRQAGLGDMQEGDNLGVAVGDDMAREPFEGGAAGAARVHQRRDSRLHARLVGMDAETGEAFEDMNV
jgi:hypothetical protein